jgi:predicted aspartyl protease
VLDTVKCFGWKLERSRIFGFIKRPVAKISLKANNQEWQPIVVYVDSGADATVLKRSFGELIGIDIEKGQEAEFGGVSSHKIKTFIYNVILKIGEYEISARVAFASNDIPPNLLGRIDIFDRFDIRFNSKTEETCFSFSDMVNLSSNTL